MTNFTFETTASASSVNVTVYLNGVFQQTFELRHDAARGLAESIMDAFADYPSEAVLEDALAAAQSFKVGQRVYYDGSDKSVFAPAGEGTVHENGTDWTTVEFERDDKSGDTYMQMVANSALTPVNDEKATDPREGVRKALRDAMDGQQVIIKDEPKAITAGGEEDEVYYEAGTVATIMSWEDYNERGLGAGFYDEDANFPVRDDSGLVQVVGLDWCTPTDKTAVTAAAKRVGAEFADRLGIRPGVEVLLPPVSLTALIFGQGTVVSVKDGEAVVNIADAAEETFLVASLVTV